MQFKKCFEKERYILIYFKDSSITNETVLVKNHDSRKKLTFRTSDINTAIKFEDSKLDAIEISESNIFSKLILENVTIDKTSYISNKSHINTLVLSNLQGSRLVISNSIIETLYILVNPNSLNPTKIQIDDCDIRNLEIITNEYFDKIPEIRLSSVRLNNLNLQASIINNNDIDFSLCYFYPDILISDYNNFDKRQNDRNKTEILYSISQQYKKHGNFQGFLEFKAKWKEQENRQNKSLVLGRRTKKGQEKLNLCCIH
ncbi:MAG: hypothetical protein WAT79_10610 [Saprospiraceae bacterium]